MSSLRNARRATAAGPCVSFWPIRLLFALEAASFALVLPRIPDIRLALGLSDGALGVALLGIPAGTLAGLVVAPATVRKAGPRTAAWASVIALAWAFVLPGLASSQLSLLGAFFACGIAVSHSEVALNGLAGGLEAVTGRRIMSQCHGFWSIGSIAAAIVGGMLAQSGMPLSRQSTVAGVVLTACVLSLAPSLPRSQNAVTSAPSDHAVAVPSRDLVALCVLPVGIMIIEGVFMDWSAIHLRSSVGADPFGGSLGFVAFALAMAVVRLFGDALTARFGERQVVVASNLAAGVGTLVFALAPTLAVGCVGAAVGGAGVAVVYPVALSAAARAPGVAARNIAAVSFTSFAILLGSPAAFGLLAEDFGFRIAIAVCAVLVLPALFLARGLAGRSD